MRVFVAVVDLGSQSAAADHLDLSRPVVSRYLAELEDWVGARLMHRTTRKLSLTAAGSETLPRCRQMLELCSDMQAAVSEPDEAPRGLLRLSVSTSFGQAQLADAQVQLAAEVVQTYADVRDQQARLALVDASVEIEEQALDLTQQRRSRGVASQLQLEQVLTQAENTRAQRLPLQASIVEAIDQLNLLCGLEPGELDASLNTPRALPAIPSQVPFADPAAILKARPDIRVAERQLASSNAQIGEKTADWFPKLSLMGDLSFSAADPGHLARKDSGTWLLLPRLTWNALDFGRVAASVKGAEAGRDEALAHYKSVVLSALRDADVALARYGNQRQNVVLLRNVESSAVRAADLTRQRYKAGTASTLDWLDAERTRYQAQESRISGDALLLKDFASLHKALGLGWTL